MTFSEQAILSVLCFRLISPRFHEKIWDVSGSARAPLRYGSATPTSSTASQNNNDTDIEGVVVNGYWFPSQAAAAESPAGRSVDLLKATVEAVGGSACTEPREERVSVSVRADE